MNNAHVQSRRLYEVVRVDTATNSITEWVNIPARDRLEALRRGRDLFTSPAGVTRARLVRPAGRYPVVVPD